MEDALELDELDKIRISNNINSLKNDNIPYLEYMVQVPINSLTEIKSKEDIINKMLIDYIIASSSIYMLNNNIYKLDILLSNINKIYNTDSILSIEDKTLIINIINKLYTLSELEEFSIRMESVNVCLWALGLVDKIDSCNKCNYVTISKLLLKFKNYDELVNSTKLRSKEEILEKADLITRYYWAIREVRNDDKVIEKLNEKIVDIQSETFDFITSYSYDSLSNKNIKIECNKNDLKFEFEIPSSLIFERISNDSKELVALRSEDKTTRLVIHDLGRINIDEYESKVDKYINMFVKSGFKVFGRYIHHSTLLEKEITRIVARKGSTSLNVYFIYVSNHLIRIDSLIESFLDSSNYKEVINAKNTNIDFDLVFSIKGE